MPTARMLAGGIVEPAGGDPGSLAAIVAVSAGAQGSRLFKVEGSTNEPTVRELSAATTIDLGRMQREVEEEIQSAVRAIVELGGVAGVEPPSTEWVCDQVREHLRATEGLEIG